MHHRPLSSSSSLGGNRWVFHKHQGDPYTIDVASTKHSNYKSINDTQKLFFENQSTYTRPGTSDTYGYRPGSAKNEIIIRKKVNRPQTAMKKTLKMNNNHTEQDQELKQTKKLPKYSQLQTQDKVVKEFIPLDQINYQLVDDTDKKDKISIDIEAKDLRKNHQSNILNPVFKFMFDYDLLFQNDSRRSDKLTFQLDQQEIFSIFKNFKAQLPKNATYSQCNCQDEFGAALQKSYDQIQKQEDEIERLQNEKEVLKNELDQVKADNQQYIQQANNRKELRLEDLNWNKIVEEKNLEIDQVKRENQKLQLMLDQWREELKEKKEEKPVYKSDNEEINALNDYIEKLLLRQKETELELQYIKIQYTEKAQPECLSTYEELETFGDQLIMIMREQDNIYDLIKEHNSKNESKMSEISIKNNDTKQMQMIVTNQLEQMTRKCRNKLEELKKGPQSNEELVAILECNIEINERIREVGYMLRKKINDQKVVIEKRQFSKFEVNEDKMAITILPDQKVIGTSTQTEEDPKINASTQTFKEPDEDTKTVEKEVNEFFQYFRFLKTLCAKSGSLEAIKAIEYFGVFAEKMDKFKQDFQMKELQLDSTRYRADKNERDVKELKEDNEYLKTQSKKMFTELNDQILAKDSKLLEVNQEWKTLKKDFMYKLDAEKKKIEKDLLHQITTLRNDNEDKSHRIAKLTVDSQRKINELETIQKKLEDDLYNMQQLNQEKTFELELKNKEAQQLEKTYLDRIVQIENDMLNEKYRFNTKLIQVEEELQSNQNKGKLQNNKNNQDIIYVENCQNCKQSQQIDNQTSKQDKSQMQQANGPKNIESFKKDIIECSGEIASLQKKYSQLKFTLECWNRLPNNEELLACSNITVDRHYNYSQHKLDFDKNSDLKINFKLQNVKSLLETKCIMLNQMGVVEEVIEKTYNESRCKSVLHSGYSKDKIEQNIYDHHITLKLSKLPKNIKALAFIGYTEKNLLEFKHGFLQIYEEGKAKYHQDFKDFTKTNTVLLNFIYRNKEGNFSTSKCSKFVRIRALSNTFLSKFLTEQYAAAECHGTFDKEKANWDQNSNQTFQLEPSMILPVPKCAYKQFTLGLGWNTKFDIDASIIMIDKENNVYDTIFFGNLKSKDGSVIHKGDSREGGDDGKEDEYIAVSLQQVNSVVQSMFVYVSVYTGGKTFEDVQDVYCNFSVKESQTPFCNFELKPPQNASQASSVILLEIFRIQNTLWAIRPSNYYLTGIENAKQAIPILQQIINYDYSGTIE